jgi:hypothetical protein
MARRACLLLVAWLPLTSATPALAQEIESFSDSELTREQWQPRVEQARRRSEEFVAGALNRTAESPPFDVEDDAAEAADQRAMNDPDLRPGDIIATRRGFLVFVGRDENHRASNFVPAANPPRP